jgi:hypothetical protein
MPVVPFVCCVFLGSGKHVAKEFFHRSDLIGRRRACKGYAAPVPAMAKDVLSRKLRSLRLTLRQVVEAEQERR